MNWAKLHSAELDFEVFWQNVLQNFARRDWSVPAFVAISDTHNLGFIANWRCPPAKWRLLVHHCCCLLQPLQRIGEEGLEMLTFNESLDVVWMEAQMVYALVSGSWVEEPKFDRWDRQVSVHKCCQMSRLFMMNDGAVQNDYHNHRFVQRPKNAKADAAIPASKQYKPQLQQLHCSSCNQANGPRSRSEAPGSAPDDYEHTTVCL